MSHITWIPAPRRMYFLGTPLASDAALPRPRLVASWRFDAGSRRPVCAWQVVADDRADDDGSSKEASHGRRK